MAACPCSHVVIMMNVLKICVKQQKLFFYNNRCLRSVYPVSTAKQGVGQQAGSMMTPQGWHVVRAKIGSGMPMDAVFKGRRVIGRYPHLVQEMPEQDWILGRILWLSGLEVARNRLGDVDTMRRYIYIHGTPDPVDGVPRSAGCIRMRCKDVVALYDQVTVGNRIYIQFIEKGEQ